MDKPLVACNQWIERYVHRKKSPGGTMFKATGRTVATLSPVVKVIGCVKHITK